VDLAAEIVEAAYEAHDSLGSIAASEVISAEVFVFNAVFEHVPRCVEHGCGHSDDGFFGAAACFEAQELGLQIAALDAHGSPGGRDQCGLEPRCTFADAGRTTFTGAPWRERH